MAYEQKPDTGTLFTNDRKAAENHPDYNGKLLISQDLLTKLAKYGEGMIEISAWVKETKAGKTIINLQCKEPYKFDKTSSPPPTPQPHRSGAIVETDRGIAFTEYRQPEPPTKPERYLGALKAKIAKIENYPQFEELYIKVKSPKSWEVFQSVPAIALEAGEILSRKKAELVLAIAPIDLSDILSKIDVECDRLRLPKKEHCLARWDKPRSALTEAELLIYLDELQSAQAIAKDDEFF